MPIMTLLVVRTAEDRYLIIPFQNISRNVLAGVISFGIGCGRTDIPDVFANVQKALCFIDYEVKCKHGRQFLNHFDYQTECSTW